MKLLKAKLSSQCKVLINTRIVLLIYDWFINKTVVCK